MLSIVLKVLSILGILLLCILGLAVILLLSVLFFPICYKISGKKDTGPPALHVRASWLFGFLRICFEYPEPGKFLIKLLFFTVFDSGKESDSKASPKSSVKAAKKEDKAGKRRKPSKAEEGKKATTGKGQKSAEAENGRPPSESDMTEKKTPAESEGKQPESAAEQGQNPVKPQQGQEDTSENKSGSTDPEQEIQDDSPLFFKKINKIKYTIRSLYDKIKNIWENISYYIDLLKEKETKELFSHVIFRVGKILKNIRPRHLKGQILFGTGSPDTTGYAYGIYGMLMPHLGGSLLVTPDFTRAVLEGDIYIAGHITVFTILWNGMRVLLDRKLRRFIKKIKAGRKM